MANYIPAALGGLGGLSRNDATKLAVSESIVHRILRGQNLYRRSNQSASEEIIQAIMHELSNSGQNSGYRQMRQRLLINHDVIASSELVRLVLNVVDPDGMISMKSRRLQRRIYTNKGPNYAIHIDGWDKLIPFGISVPSAVDGFSRCVLWLRACNSNKKKQYIARYYVDYIKEVSGVPVRVYADRGTENVIVRDLQYALRWIGRDPFQGQSSFVYVSSTRNVRIERFSLREMCGQTWINHFKDMSDLEVLDTSDNLHLEYIRFGFLALITENLDRVRRLLNEHRVRASRFAECPAGKPHVLFFQPQLSGGREYKLPVPDDIEAVEQEYCQFPPVDGVSTEFRTLANHVIQQKNLRFPPRTCTEATELFIEITRSTDQFA